MIRPMKDRILVKPIKNPETSEGGIFIGQATTTFVADKDKAEQVTMGEIIAIGPGKRNKRGQVIPIDAKCGDVVTFSDTCGRQVELDGEQYLFIREGDIAGFIDGVNSVEVLYR